MADGAGLCAVRAADGRRWFLASRQLEAAGPLRLELCDGTNAFVGHLDDLGLTPPKFGISREQFRQKFVAALHRPGECDTVCVEQGQASGVRLVWHSKLTKDADIGGITVQLRQAVHMTPEINAGGVLRSMLVELAADLLRSESSLDAHQRRLGLLEVRILRESAHAASLVRSLR